MDINSQFSNTQSILREYGLDIDDDLLGMQLNESIDNSDNILSSLSQVLGQNAIPSKTQMHAGIMDITDELVKGHQVLVELDQSKLDGGLLSWLKDFFLDSTPDCAYIVAGIDINNPGEQQVVLLDPETGMEARRLSIDRFVYLWKDSSCSMLTTEVPTLRMQNFFEQHHFDMHLPTVGQLNYDHFNQIHQNFNELSEEQQEGVNRFNMLQEATQNQIDFYKGLAICIANPELGLQPLQNIINEHGGTMNIVKPPLEDKVFVNKVGDHDYTHTTSQLIAEAAADHSRSDDEGSIPEWKKEAMEKIAKREVDLKMDQEKYSHGDLSTFSPMMSIEIERQIRHLEDWKDELLNDL